MLKFLRTENGFARVYYQSEEKGLLCFQESMRGQFELFRCTKSGEPEYAIAHAGQSIDRLPNDSSSTAKAFSAWSEKIGLTGDSPSP